MRPSSASLATRPVDNSPITTRTLALALAVIGLGLAVSLIVGDAASGGWLIAVHASCLVAVFVMWKQTRWVDAWSRYLSFGAVVLFACMLNRVIYISDILLAGDRVNEFPFYAAAPQMAMRKAEVATAVGTVLTYFYWVRGGGGAYSPGSLLRTGDRSYIRVLVITYLFSMGGIFISNASNEVLAATGQLLPTMFGLGTASAFLLPYLVLDSPRARFLMVAITTAPFVYAALGTGMKENIIIAMLPAGYLLWTSSKSWLFRGAIVVVAGLSLAMVTAYVEYYRNVVWGGKRALDQNGAMSDFMDDTKSGGGVLDVASKGVEDFIRRADAGSYRGWAVALADEYRQEPELVFGPIAYVFVPRLLWPEKPLIRQGWEYSGLVFGKEYATFGESSTSAGLYSGLYLGGGWIAVIAGGMILGWVMSRITRFAFRLGGTTLVGLYTFCMLPFALRVDEQWTVGAFSGPVINLAYMFIVYRVANVLSDLIGGSQSARFTATRRT